MSHQNLATIDAAFDAYSRGDLEAAADMAAPDVVVTQLEDIPGNRTFLGRQGFLDVIADWQGEWDDFRIERLRTRDFGDNVVVTVRETGRGKSSGVEVTGVFTFLFTFTDGRVVRWRIFADEAEALASLRGTTQGNPQWIRRRSRANLGHPTTTRR
ncbi:MAG TPA: nuclear transport factor 2 family protein [Thermoleophilaceae bacterium]|jgi:ketosteroid isomerase-like protein